MLKTFSVLDLIINIRKTQQQIYIHLTMRNNYILYGLQTIVKLKRALLRSKENIFVVNFSIWKCFIHFLREYSMEKHQQFKMKHMCSCINIEENSNYIQLLIDNLIISHKHTQFITDLLTFSFFF